MSRIGFPFLLLSFFFFFLLPALRFKRTLRMHSAASARETARPTDGRVGVSGKLAPNSSDACTSWKVGRRRRSVCCSCASDLLVHGCGL